MTASKLLPSTPSLRVCTIILCPSSPACRPSLRCMPATRTTFPHLPTLESSDSNLCVSRRIGARVTQYQWTTLAVARPRTAVLWCHGQRQQPMLLPPVCRDLRLLPQLRSVRPLDAPLYVTKAPTWLEPTRHPWLAQHRVGRTAMSLSLDSAIFRDAMPSPLQPLTKHPPLEKSRRPLASTILPTHQALLQATGLQAPLSLPHPFTGPMDKALSRSPCSPLRLLSHQVLPSPSALLQIRKPLAQASVPSPTLVGSQQCLSRNLRALSRLLASPRTWPRTSVSVSCKGKKRQSSNMLRLTTLLLFRPRRTLSQWPLSFAHPSSPVAASRRCITATSIEQGPQHREQEASDPIVVNPEEVTRFEKCPNAKPGTR